jgi:hypothetical protein
MQRPDSVPEWLWETYQSMKDPALLAESGPFRFPLQEPVVKVLDGLMADPRCAVVWNAMTRRRGTEYKAFRSRNGLDSLDDTSREDVETLLARIPIMAAGLLEEDKVLEAARSRQGAKIAQAVHDLREALSDVRLPTGWPHPFAMAFGNESIAIAKLTSDGSREKWAMTVFFDPFAALDVAFEALPALGTAAASWGAWQSSVSRPKDPNAARLRFIREITGFFRRMYDSPLREPVAVLTNSLFDCDIDASTVAKLAP